MTVTLMTTYLSSNGKKYLMADVPAWKFHGERPNGDPYLESEERAAKVGWHTAMDPKGYEYACGYAEKVETQPDGTAVFTDIRAGKTRRFTRDNAAIGEGSWVEDTTHDASKKLPSNLVENSDRWLRVKGAAMDRSSGRGHTIDTVRQWPRAYKAGEASSLWLYGEPGRGKSQLAAWLAMDLAEAGVKFLHIEWPDYVAKVQAGYSGDANVAERLINEAKNVAVLIIDDFGRGKVTPDVNRIATELWQYRITYNRLTVVTSNFTQDGLSQAGWEDPLVSRCKTAVLLDFKGPDYRVQKSLSL